MKNQNSTPGTGSDKQHPQTPPDANERFRKNNEKDNKKNVEENPGEQNTG